MMIRANAIADTERRHMHVAHLRMNQTMETLVIGYESATNARPNRDVQTGIHTLGFPPTPPPPSGLLSPPKYRVAGHSRPRPAQCPAYRSRSALGPISPTSKSLDPLRSSRSLQPSVADLTPPGSTSLWSVPYQGSPPHGAHVSLSVASWATFSLGPRHWQHLR